MKLYDVVQQKLMTQRALLVEETRAKEVAEHERQRVLLVDKVTLLYDYFAIPNNERVFNPVYRDARWSLTVDREIRFIIAGNNTLWATLLPSVCSKGCAKGIAHPNFFMHLLEDHLSHADHAPNFPDPPITPGIPIKHDDADSY